MNTMTVKKFLADKGEKTEAALALYLENWIGAPEALVEAVRYSLFGGGKKLRPALALGAAEIVSGDDVCALPAACALEMIHTYSLVHDDLPAMDNDDLRRGRPTAHVVYGEATAILVGDALLTMAFDVLAQADNMDAIRELAQAAGIVGMVGGQFADMQGEGQQHRLEALQEIHRRKTGALIQASVRLGAMLGGGTSEQIEALGRYGEHLGLAFQIADDILDVVGDTAALGKTAGSDASRHKSTYPALLGLEEARRLADETTQAAIDTLAIFGEEANLFRAMARFVVERSA
jgi:geranylgeranyl diphosphate synthase type II